jgi:3',5'-cyclic AMP phosphodiesterase CpdA
MRPTARLGALALSSVLALCATASSAQTSVQTSALPERVIANLTDAPATSLAFNWRAAPGSGDGFVEYARLTPGPAFAQHALRVAAVRTPAAFRTRDEQDVSADYYGARVTGLAPATQYVYRVGKEGAWSPWRQVRTASTEAKPFTFLYLGDVQNDILSLGGHAVRRALRDTPDAAFMLFTGDLINRADNDAEWGEWFEMAVDPLAETPSLMSPGNHEYMKPAGATAQALARQWRLQFSLPDNAPAEALSETVYRVDYQGARLISLDADMMDESADSARAQVAWLERQLAGNPGHWAVVFMHYPLYSTAKGRDGGELRAVLQPIFDRYGVDLVLAGHDHTYGRGRPHAKGPVYMVSNAGPKQYPLGDLDWTARKGSGIQLYQQVEVSPSKLTVRAYTLDGILYDAFRLDKPGKGPAKLADLKPASPELILRQDDK